MSTAIVWFRRDLRLSDQPALDAACRRHDHVVGLYVHAPAEDGDWPPGGAQRWWLHHSLTALAAAVDAAGSQLVIRRGPAATALADLLTESEAAAVYWNRLYEPAAIERDRGLKAWLRNDLGVTAESFNGGLLTEPGRIATGTGGPYRVFTPFWRRVTAFGLDDEPLPFTRNLAGPGRRFASQPVAGLGLLPTVPWDAGLEASWTPGEAGALDRLDRFIAAILPGYDTARDRPALDGTSALSPHLHFGEVGPRQVVAAVRASRAADSRGAATYLSEVGWREFAHHLLYHFPQTPTEPLNERFRAFPWRDAESEAAADLRAWHAGRTGIPLVDAGMRQLWHQGWMHNRIRMVVASFLTKNLRLHWLVGARWFWDTLVDADLASNTLGWQWAGGCGADAAPYFRVFNPVRQGERFDPHGDYVRRWIPELAALSERDIHAPWNTPAARLRSAGVRLGTDYPEPVVDLAASRRAALAAFEAVKRTPA